MMPSLQHTSTSRVLRPGSPIGEDANGLIVDISSKTYPLATGKVFVHRNLSFHVRRGQFMTLLGPSGCGKSTVLRMIAGLDTDFEGRISLGGKDLTSPGRDRGIVFQESRLLPWLSVQSNIAFALPRHLNRMERLRRMAYALKAVGLRKFRRAWTHQLSGGMAKRVALARAIVNVPDLLLLDEPFGALDSLTKFALHDELRKIHEVGGTTTLLVTHDVDEAVYLSDVVAVLSPAPTTVRSVVDIDLPVQRDRSSPEFSALRARLMDELFAKGTV